MNPRYLLGLLFMTTAGTATAHMPYVAPSVFDAGTRGQVTIEASFTEDAFRPEIAMKDAPFEITGPGGATTLLPEPKVLGDLTVVAAMLPADGIYRVSSGQRSGRIGRMYRAGNEWRMVGDGDNAPVGATLVAVQSLTIADAYIVRGRSAGLKALAPRMRALEIHPLSDPTRVGAGDPFALQILQDGKPLPGAELSLFREAGLYDGRKVISTVRTDPSGKVSLRAPDAGRYLILVRNRVAAPALADTATPYLSYTATLAFEATQ